MTVEVFDVEQGSPEWHQARVGIPTASRFADILAKGEGKTRGKYLRELAAEVLTGEADTDGYTNGHMERGKLVEDEARNFYALIEGVDPQRVGFVRNGRTGCSPDSFIGERRGLEIKTAIRHIQIERLQRGTLPSEHKAQVQGSMWVCERDSWDFVSYCPKLPPLIVAVHRDEAFISDLAKAVQAFNEELDSLVDALRTGQNFKQQAAA
jgi:hypothetical protein